MKNIIEKSMIQKMLALVPHVQNVYLKFIKRPYQHLKFEAQSKIIQINHYGFKPDHSIQGTSSNYEIIINIKHNNVYWSDQYDDCPETLGKVSQNNSDLASSKIQILGKHSLKIHMMYFQCF